MNQVNTISRRDFLYGSLSVAGLLTLASCAGASSSLVGRDVSVGADAPTFVLVHGAWHGGWCWRDVRELLQKSGARVFTPTLAGLGKREHLTAVHDVGLATHIQDVVNLIYYEELENVILVGHSYAGLVVTGVADKLGDKISELIYLDALVPVDGGSLIDLDNVMPDSQVTAIVAGIETDVPGMLPVATLAFLGIETDHPNAAWVKRRMTPHPVKTIIDRLRFNSQAHEMRKKTYVFCTEQERPKEARERTLSIADRPDWDFLEIASGHDAMVTEPEKLADILVKIVARQ